MLIPLSKTIQLRPINIEDQPFLQDLMHRIYPQAYKHLWKDQGNWYVQQTFNVEALQKELGEENAPYFFVEQNNQAIGILRLDLKKSLLELPEKRATKFHRVYLDSSVQGQGIGKMLMAFAYEEARRFGSEIIWLEAMDTQKQALEFYKKEGFKIAEPFRLSFDLMHESLRGMYKMWREL